MSLILRLFQRTTIRLDIFDEHTYPSHTRKEPGLRQPLLIGKSSFDKHWVSMFLEFLEKRKYLKG